MQGTRRNPEMLKSMCRNDRTALDALDKATTGKRGGDQKSSEVGINTDNISIDTHDVGRLRRKSVTHHFSTTPRAFGLYGKRGAIAIMTVGDTIIAYFGKATLERM